MLSIETNDTLALANLIEFEDSSVEVISGVIGDNEALEEANDVDLFAVQLNAGETIFADINAEINGSDLDSVITIFDAAGNLLVQNDDNSFEFGGDFVTELDPFQQFTAIEAGTYYIGVSSFSDSEYDPTVAGSNVGETSGAYSLILSLEEFSANDLGAEPNDTIRFANRVELDDSEPVVISGVIGDNAALISEGDDVDLFEVELEAGETLIADIDAERIGSSLDSVLSIFDINGELLVQKEDNSFELEEELVTEADPFEAFTAPEDGTYYVGVSGSGETSGFYNLVLSFGEEIVEIEIDDLEVDEIIPDERFPDTGVDDLDSIIDDRMIDDSVIDTVDRTIVTNSDLSI
ncbi:MAG: DVUA0089 family protein [Xenococcus sp. (in: cyanobacteria)]